jgi:diacylglycerol kinase (ATP)
MPRLALLANPESGTGEADRVAAVLRAHDGEVTSFGLDQLEQAREARAERYVVAGGDGSIGSVAELAAAARAPLAVVPVGTANDFARALGIPLDASQAAALAATGHRTRRLDLARARGKDLDERAFVNAASAGRRPQGPWAQTPPGTVCLRAGGDPGRPRLTAAPVPPRL